MTETLERNLAAIERTGAAEQLALIRRGIEKESLRVTPDGVLATTPHPRELGAALTHSWITTDYSESLLEFITPVCDSVDGMLDFLADLRFTGDVWAIPEGLPVFGDEPMLRVTAPLAQAQLVETALLNQVCYSSLVASNASQLTAAAWFCLRHAW